MKNKCSVCDKDAVYTCPKCSVRYCSSECNKKHRETCVGIEKEKEITPPFERFKLPTNILEQNLSSNECRNLLSSKSIRDITQDREFQKIANEIISLNTYEEMDRMLKEKMENNFSMKKFTDEAIEIISNLNLKKN